MQRSTQIRPAARDRKQRAIRPTRLRAAHPRRGNAEIILPLSLENTIKKPSNYTKSMSTQSSKTTKTPSKYRVGMFSAGEARCDRWQEMAHAAQALVAQSAAGSSTKEALAQVEDLFRHLNILEAFHAYPGESLMAALKEALGRDDYSGFSKSAPALPGRSSPAPTVAPQMRGNWARKENKRATNA